MVVGRKKRVARVRSSCHSMPCLLANDEDDDKSNADRRMLLGKLREAEVRLRDSSFADNFFHCLEDSLTALNANGIANLLCYGLGHFSNRRSSKYQLALLLCLKRRYSSRVYAYDPIFSPQEIELLRELGCDPIERNEEGKRDIGGNVTLVYMPHCSTRLINNFLYANWGKKLNKCILLTNSFTIVLDDRRKMNGSDPVDYISRVRPYVTEVALRNDFPYEEAFNDSHIHIFLKRDIDAIPGSFWNEREEPRYPDAETDFFTARQTESSDTSTRTDKDER